ncbi:multidrug DMT transporter permease [Reichenbachiella carrageenanivorans]|uniref:Multidrug DMT transporter permease n=1 Tax=Reichenbachiella carrageenanivorans TaxID=2979869 RepID=A0ABY6DB36_9BACT|nr:multidrug DMT transporter permease [Reichenbachiella carrageenanivorans]UXX81050.1 multidrug DMT transporter permease [Reichenbachiella carrageenanivorans]
MIIIQSFPVAVALCFVTMLCWGSWANTQKLSKKDWPFQLFYWDYAIGVLLFSIVLAFTMGSMGQSGRSFLDDLAQASLISLGLALLGGVVFNLANILLVAAIDIAGMAVAFPVGIGIALVLGVITNYLAAPSGDPVLLFSGVAFVTVAVLLDAWAYRKISTDTKVQSKGLVLSVIAGVLMGFFYRFVAASMSPDFNTVLEVGKLTPYTAIVFFSVGLLLSNFIFNTIVMKKPFVGDPVSFADYFKKENRSLHFMGILGGMIWNLGMSLSIVASGIAGFAVSYGLGQGATMIAAFWGVFIWREFSGAPKGTNKLLVAMFISFIAGLSLIIISKLV